ncbi:nucleoside deaminase [Planococcus sp. ISL-109]|uniref:nucleoside deaminase n=1 Tax=Planococcus sp. ISL-109 TaxID=2819166 RepID=UPI001BE5D33F|nr:nucleoside deaminase [Planococcus sp. ISL-109]MBT2581338.1 nucleoside deaminase [Planococcus sp. ISL-109]
MDRFMERAVSLALMNVEEGGQPFGAVLVKDGEIIAEGVNELHKAHDVSGHAEMLAVRRAQEELQAAELPGTIMYASSEPCPMCLTAMYFAGIEKIIYCCTIDEAVAAGLGKSQEIYEDLQKSPGDRMLRLHHMPLTGEQVSPMRIFAERSGN